MSLFLNIPFMKLSLKIYFVPHFFFLIPNLGATLILPNSLLGPRLTYWHLPLNLMFISISTFYSLLTLTYIHLYVLTPSLYLLSFHKFSTLTLLSFI